MKTIRKTNFHAMPFSRSRSWSWSISISWYRSARWSWLGSYTLSSSWTGAHCLSGYRYWFQARSTSWGRR